MDRLSIFHRKNNTSSSGTVELLELFPNQTPETAVPWETPVEVVVGAPVEERLMDDGGIGRRDGSTMNKFSIFCCLDPFFDEKLQNDTKRRTESDKVPRWLRCQVSCVQRLLLNRRLRRELIGAVQAGSEK